MGLVPQTFSAPNAYAVLILIGILFVVSCIAGHVGNRSRSTWLLGVHLHSLFALFVILFLITVFSAIAVYKGAGEDDSAWYERGSKDCSLARVWEKQVVQDYIGHSNVCKSLEANNGAAAYDDGSDYAIKSGCCKPPTCCNFVYLGGTTWVATTQGSICTKDVDCRTWSNDAAKLCYNCLSCKAAVLATAEREIKTGVIFSIVFLFYIIFAYSIAARRLSHTLREM
ncbi:tetraspanin-8-like [Panicum virgatum]|uniref:tetraspanin-8-like n=1 Tax=Panicum virgatum TaxID=38727 RepID=UPI0019D5AE03|nr:tetraspanin-8-like [Panicum virgatum]XP_039833127.1 tetraspanin-8-like [Panicum virgatum]